MNNNESRHEISNNVVCAASITRLAIDRSICILTRPVVITGFNRSLLVNWWSIGRLTKLGSCDDTWHYYIPCFNDSIKTKSSLL